MNNEFKASMIQNYLKGTLSPSDMHQIEKEALDDPFLQDALEGFGAQDETHFRQLSMLQRRLEDRIAEQQQVRNAFHFNIQRLAIASTAGVLLIVLCILFWMRLQPLSKDQPDTKEVVVELKSSVTTQKLSGNAHPSLGWARYHEFLSTHLSSSHPPLKASDKATLSFQIKDGKPQQIKVIATTNETWSQEVIRLIQEGPGWKGDSVLLKIQY